MQISGGRIKSLSPQELGWDRIWREWGETCGKRVWLLSIWGLRRSREKALQERKDLRSILPMLHVMPSVLQEIANALFSPLYYCRFLEQRPENNNKKTSLNPRLSHDIIYNYCPLIFFQQINTHHVQGTILDVNEKKWFCAIRIIL